MPCLALSCLCVRTAALARCVRVPPPEMNFKKFEFQFGKRLTHVADLEGTFAEMDTDSDGRLSPREQSAITKLLHMGKEL